MNAPTTDRIRNVALVGHSGSGKTSLAEALLHRAGVLPRAGSTDEGSTVCDTEPEEIKRKMSISVAVAPFEWKATDPTTGEAATYKINLLDTPGYADFAGEVDAALAVADLAVLVVSAVDGIEVGTEAAWRRCAAIGIPRMVFVNKEDKPRADFHRTLDQLRATFGSGFVPLELPLGEEEKLHGVADVLTDEGLEYDADGTHHSEPIPADVADEEHRLHDEIVEEIVAGDDEQLERYLSGEVPSAAELERTLAGEMLRCAEFPVLLGSAITGVGIDRLADYLCELGPSPPTGRPPSSAAPKQVPVPADASGTSVAYVFKTVADQFVGQVSLFKVLSGTVHGDDRLVNSTTSTEERLHGLFHLRGKEHLTVNQVVAGDIGGIAKLAATPSHSTLAAKGSPVRVEVASEPAPPNYKLALEPVTQSDDDKLSDALSRLVSEDPTLQRRALGGDAPDGAVRRRRHAPRRRPRTARPQVRRQRVHRRGQGALPRDDLGDRRRRGQGQEAERRPRPVRRRQHARRPDRARAAVSEFVDSIVGGAIPRNFLPAVQKGTEETMATRRRVRLPRRRRAGRVLRRQVPLRRLVRHGVPHGGVARSEGGARQGVAGGARTGVVDHRQRARVDAGRRPR